MRKLEGSLWNGIFKSYTVVNVIPVSQMTAEDWQLLDWDNLRNKAKNRIAEKAESLAGFAMVSIFNKARAKTLYLQPMTEEEREFFEMTGDLPFGNEADQPELTDPAEAIEDYRNRIRDLALFVGTGALINYILSSPPATAPEEFREDIEEIETNLQDGLDIGLALALTLVRFLGYASTEDYITQLEDDFFAAEDDLLTEADDS